MTQTIEVLVLPTGETKITSKGFIGGSCQQASEFLERALGIATSEQKTAEFYQSAEQQQPLRQQGSA